MAFLLPNSKRDDPMTEQIVKISPIIISDTIKTHFGIDLIPITNNFYKQVKPNGFILYYSEVDSSLISIYKIQYYGIPILRMKRNNIILYPAILQVFQCNQQIAVSISVARKITYGSSVQLDVDDGIYSVQDPHRRTVAIGRVLRGEFTPIIDIGLYLRGEKFW